MRSLTLFAMVATLSLVLGGCARSISPDQATISVKVFGDYVIAEESFDIGYEVDLVDNREDVEYEVRVTAQGVDGQEYLLHSQIDVGSKNERVTVALPAPGEFQFIVSIAPEGAETVWVESAAVALTAVDAGTLEAEITNVPDFWLVDEPYSPEGRVHGGLDFSALTVSAEVKQGNQWVQIDSPAGQAATIMETEETRRTIRLGFLSGEYRIAQSDELEIWFATPQSMVQEFFYQARSLDNNEYYDFWIKHTYPGFLIEEKLDKDEYLREMEEYGRRSTDPLLETVRERPDFAVGARFLDYYPCLQSPNPDEVMPGKHFIFDYQTPYTLLIGDTLVGGGLERNSRHVTFLDGRLYFYEGHC